MLTDDGTGILNPVSQDLDNLRVRLDEAQAESRGGAASPTMPPPRRQEERPLIWANRQIGRYRIERELSRSGVSGIYLASRCDDELSQQVALELIDGDLSGEEMLRRFRHKRRVMRALDHPHIARGLDCGVTEHGSPYFVMEFVRGGVPIDEYCRRNEFSLNERLRLFRVVCDAVQYAHQRLIVHQNLTLETILVSGQGDPKLVDFLGSPVEETAGEPQGTPVDVAALGDVLRQLASLGEAPERPLRGDLANIARRAAGDHPDGRYSSVDQLSEDVRRYLDGLPVMASEDTYGYRLGKILRRRGGAVVATVMLMSTLIAALLLTAREAAQADVQAALATDHARQANASRDRAERQLKQAQAFASSLIFDFHHATVGTAHEVADKKALEYLGLVTGEAGLDPKPSSDLAAAYRREFGAGLEVLPVLIDTYVALGDRSAKEDPQDGLAYYARALEFSSQLAGKPADPAHGDWRRYPILVHNRMADALSRLGRAEEARQHLRQSAEIAAFPGPHATSR